MVTSGLDRQVKEIDALTYNARTALNAMIRTVAESGSNKGFKVTRVGHEIFLTRVDIYRISKFYEDWAINNYSRVNVAATSTQKNLKGFDTLVAQHDATPVRDDQSGEIVDSTATTTGLVKHSQILFLTSDNESEFDNTSYWLDLIKNHNNAKLVSNTAPIPLNLRTPIFDENLSTTKYNQHATYLFPMDYFTADLLGFSGDATDHNLDGKSWIISADEFIRLESDDISVGGVIANARYKTADTRTGKYSFSFGFDSHARADFSLAGGNNSIVPRNSEEDIALAEETEEQLIQNAIAIGEANIASSALSAAIGGSFNSAAGFSSGVFGGSDNYATGRFSAVLGGNLNKVGGEVYEFFFPEDELSSIDDTNTDSQNTGISNERNHVITVPGNVSEILTVDNEIVLFDFSFKGKTNDSNKYYNDDGSADESRVYTILTSEYIEIGSGRSNEGSTVITIDGDVPQKGTITGGLLSLNQGRYSAASGFRLIVQGRSQFGVGESNEINTSAKFLVGAGSRSNSFEVYNNGFITYGTPLTGNTFEENRPAGVNFSGMKFYGNGLDTLVRTNRFRVYDNVEIDGARKSGLQFIGRIGETDELRFEIDTARGFWTQNKGSTTGITIANSNDAGLDDMINAVSSSEDVFSDLNLFSTTNNNIGGNNVSITALGSDATGNLTLSWNNRLLFSGAGDIFGTLPTDRNQYSHYLTDVNASNQNFVPTTALYGSSTIMKSGFYRIKLPQNPILGNGEVSNETLFRQTMLGDVNASDYHLLNVGFFDEFENYKNWQFIFGTNPRTSGHIGVRRNIIESNFDDLEANGTSYIDESQDGSIGVKHIGWLEDYQYSHTVDNVNYTNVNFGKWTQIPKNLMTVSKGKPKNGDLRLRANGPYKANYNIDVISSPETEDDDPNNVVTDLRYTKINDTLFFELRLIFSEGSFESIDGSQGTAYTNIFVTPSQNLYRLLFSPEFGYFPNFTDSWAYRKDDEEKMSFKLYNCMAVNDGKESYFSVTTGMDVSEISSVSSNTGDNVRHNIFSSVDKGNTVTFSGSYRVVTDESTLARYRGSQLE